MRKVGESSVREICSARHSPKLAIRNTQLSPPGPLPGTLAACRLLEGIKFICERGLVAIMSEKPAQIAGVKQEKMTCGLK